MNEMTDETTLKAPARTPRFTVGFARTYDEVRETQRLRYRIFAGELGAQIDDQGTGLDRDNYDPHCRHLFVRDNNSGAIVACTRILTDDRAGFTGGFYSSGEFNLGLLEHLPGRAMEIGRTCVDPAYRSGAVIALLWSGLADMIKRERFTYLFGCASIALDDGGANAHAIVEELRLNHLAPAWHRVRPRRPLPAADACLIGPVRMPPLLKAYVSLGAKACGEPFWDAEFNCADVFMLLNVGDLEPRYARRFFGKAQTQERRVAVA
jgi:putative hemolysin